MLHAIETRNAPEGLAQKLGMRVWFFCVGLLAMGCHTPSQLGTDTMRPYQWEDLPHHPKYAWHRNGPDSAVAFVQLPAHEPLHLRENRDDPFRYSLSLELILYPIQLSEVDSTSWNGQAIRYSFDWEGEAQKERQDIVARFAFPLEPGRYRITHNLKDVHRGAEVSGSFLFDALSEDAPARCFALHSESGNPVWNQQANADEKVALLVPPDLLDLVWEHAVLPPVDSFPSAPFLDRTTREIEFPEADISVKPTPFEAMSILAPPGNWEGWGVLTWENSAGLHRWTMAGSQRHILLPSRRAHFPQMRDLNEMIRATRYIATRDEYKSMRESRNPKEALDSFWLQFAGDSETARELIRTYYARVHEANLYFSGFREGWCTDRGMVHVVFGHPDRIRRDRYGETWIYGEEGEVNTLIFRFTVRASGDDFNVFELERYPGFRSPWEAMVSSWRRGKIRRR